MAYDNGNDPLSLTGGAGAERRMRPTSRNTLAWLLLAVFGALAAVGLLLGRTEWLEVLAIAALGVCMLVWVLEWGCGRPASRAGRGRLPLPLDCAIVPRRDSTAEELKRLGGILNEWWEQEGVGAGGPLLALDEDALNDLRYGELPQPFGLRLLTCLRGAQMHRGDGVGSSRLTVHDITAALHQAKDAHPAVAHLIPRADLRAVFFGLTDRTRAARERLLVSLRRHLPDDLVADVLIDGRSWTDAD